MTNTKTPALFAGGGALVLMGAAAFVPVFADRGERGAFSTVGLMVAAATLALMVLGAALLSRGLKRAAADIPRPVRIAITANALVLAFLALELSDRLVRQEGNLHYWTTWLLAPAILMMTGLVAAQRWSWWIARGATAIGVLWFLGFLLVIPFAPVTKGGVSAPLYGRAYMATVTLLFAGTLTWAFRALGRAEARRYFGVGPERGAGNPA